MSDHHDAAHAGPDDQYLNTTEGGGHEHTDANVWMIVQFAIWLVVSAVLVHGLMGLMFWWFVADRNQASAVPEFPLAVGQEERLPAGPRLQRFPSVEMYDFRQHENTELHDYGWVDKNAGTVHIPIDEAMKLAVERGLPSRAQAAPADATTDTPPGMMPADSSSGRTLERRR